VFHAFEQDAKDFAGFAKTRLTMPMPVLTGGKASGEFPVAQGHLIGDKSRASSLGRPAIGR
jgi:hypothetical protein